MACIGEESLLDDLTKSWNVDARSFQDKRQRMPKFGPTITGNPLVTMTSVPFDSIDTGNCSLLKLKIGGVFHRREYL